MAGKVVYTVLTGGYDHLEQPVAVSTDWDYVCYGDREGQDGVWQLRVIPFEGSSVMRARWAKMHPHVLFPEYQYSVFMDANLQIATPEFYDFAGENIAILEHPQRDCVWEELRYCYLKDKVSTRTALKWHSFLTEMDMPRHAGLAETNLLARAHCNPEIMALDNLWWQFLVESGGSRDQLAFTPALHKTGLKPGLLFGPGLNARNVPYVNYVNHPVIGPKNIPGKLNWANLKYNLRLLWRKTVLAVCLR